MTVEKFSKGVVTIRLDPDNQLQLAACWEALDPKSVSRMLNYMLRDSAERIVQPSKEVLMIRNRMRSWQLHP
jgi:hypothetical protein